MYGDDDRVRTLLESLKMEDRLIPFEYNEKFDYMQDVNYADYDKNIEDLKEKANLYIEKNICN